MIGFGKPFRLVDGAFKSSVKKPIPICDLIIWITTEYVGYYVIGLYEWLILCC